MKKSILRECIRIAEQKLSNHPQLDYFPHYSFVIQYNKIIEWGTNMAGVPPIHFGYHERLNGEGEAKLHSELVAWRRARDLLDNDKHWDMVNIRMSRDKTIRLSKPCSCCAAVMRELGCKKFYYSWEQGFLTSI